METIAWYGSMILLLGMCAILLYVLVTASRRHKKDNE